MGHKAGYRQRMYVLRREPFAQRRTPLRQDDSRKVSSLPTTQAVAGKNKAAAWEATARTVRVPALEPEGRTEGNFKVIVRAVIEVNFVARFKAQADRTPESLDSTSGIHGETCVPGLNSTQGSHEPCGRVLIGNAKIHEAELAGDIGPERSRAGLEFGSKQPVQGTQVRVYKLRGDAFEKTLVKFLLKSYDISASS